jgi:entericidin B
MRKILLSVFVAASMAAVAACNTVEGAGEDVSAAGSAVSGAAADAKD